MVARRTVNLGTVGFGLEADTTALEQSLRKLKAFGQQVNQVAGITGTADPMYKRFSQVERILTTLQSRVEIVTKRMRESGVAVAEINRVEQAYRRLVNTVTRAPENLMPHELNRGIAGMRAELARGGQMATLKKASNLTEVMRDLSSASIMALGPLSGVGARISIMAGLLDSANVQLGLFVVGITGAITTVSLLGAASVRAVMDMERFDAMLATSTGAAQLAGAEYEYVSGVAARLGHNVRTLIEPFSKFTTATRLSNVPLTEQRKIFEAAIIAGTAMRLNSERMGLVFLALEQMFSKGVVSMEEFRRQLGDLLPGTFGLAARAMGITEAELVKLIESATLLPMTVLPKLAEAWKETFGPGALMAAQSIRGELNRLATSTFEFLKAFDRATQFSELFRRAVILARESLDFLAQNIERIIQLLAAVAGAGAGLAFYALLVKLPAVIAPVVAGLAALRAGTLGWAAALAALQGGTIIGLLARLGLMTAGAVAGYKLLEGATRSAAAETEEWIAQTHEWIRVQRSIGPAHRQVTDRLKAQTIERLNLIQAEIEAQEALHKAQLAAHQRQVQEQGRFQLRLGLPGGAGIIMQPPLPPPPPPAEPAALKTLREQVARGRALIAELQGMELAPTPTPAIAAPEAAAKATAVAAFENWIKRIRDQIRDTRLLQDEIEAAKLGEAALRNFEALRKAMDLVAAMPEDQVQQAGLARISKELREAGFEGANLTEQLHRMFLLMAQRQEKARFFEKLPEQISKAGEAMSKMFEELETRREGAAAALGGVSPEQLRDQEALQKNLERLLEHLEKMGLEQEQINYLTEDYRRRWEAINQMELHGDKLKDLRRDIEAIRHSTRDSFEKAQFEARQQIDKINEAVRESILDAAEAARMTAIIQEDVHRQALDKTKLFGRDIKDVFRDMEQSLLDAFYDITRGIEGGWKDLFESLKRTIFDFLTRIAVIEPILTSLFGGLYTGRKGDAGTGLLEGLIGGAKDFFRGPQLRMVPGGGAGGSVGGGILDFMFMGGFQRGGQFRVGGAGGADSQMVAFAATPGETVTIQPPGSGGAGTYTPTTTIVQNINFAVGIRGEVRAEIMTLLPRLAEVSRRAVNDAERRGAR